MSAHNQNSILQNPVQPKKVTFETLEQVENLPDKLVDTQLLKFSTFNNSTAKFELKTPNIRQLNVQIDQELSTLVSQLYNPVL